MEKKKEMNELDALAQLSELALLIEKNNWEHLYKQIDSVVGYAESKEENNLLRAELEESKKRARTAEDNEQQMRIKILAVKHLVSFANNLPDDK